MIGVSLPMVYKDGGTFKEYCPKPYDRHEYHLYFRDGKSMVFDDYTTMMKYWWMHCGTDTLSHVAVVDKVQKKAVVKGF